MPKQMLQLTMDVDSSLAEESIDQLITIRDQIGKDAFGELVPDNIRKWFAISSDYEGGVIHISIAPTPECREFINARI